MSNERATNWRYFLILHLALIAISTSGPLGRAVAMAPMQVIFWRTLLAAFLFGIICGVGSRSLRIAATHRWRLLLTGLLMGAHWVTYFQALQLSSVAIGMLSIFTYPVFTAFLEPLLLRTRFQAIHLFLAGLTLVGIYFLAPDFNVADSSFQAILWGLFSALCYALRNVLSKDLITHYSSMSLMFYQMTIVACLLLPVVMWQGGGAIHTEWPKVLLLAGFTTVIGHTLFLQSFRSLSVTTVSIISAAQPVYGIVLGIIFLRELPAWSTAVGGSLILLAVVVESVRKKAVT